ncbi:ABC-F family ATP-binding cassette domain-containing protein [Peribacillus deserti]|uniref:Multidrug ABC transporter ATP-binding protein n=1 Tax=Peribacillus deserti TaxID=673318 RepID=A0A2N5M225_9BACI|nr:ABC-F family ATP-binding cassette domain-containing protein [Peribacillus deserti]PLT28410.1 multidrug ABC transporter ATP-binding protein [Peribacillus deserti]
MKVYTYTGLTKQQGEKLLFSDINFSISQGEKIGVIGVNGTGKSTLLHIIGGTEEGDSGAKEHPNDYRISLLEQDPVFDENTGLLDYMYSSPSEVFSLIRDYEKALERLQTSPNDGAIQDRLMSLQQKMDAMDAWDVSANSKAILSKLGLNDFNKKLGELSGGQKKRAALARTLIENPDLLILDEPTNHLDYQSIRWLEDYLAKYQGAVLFVTHDRYFLDRVSSKIWELSGGSLFEYLGNYSSFLEGKALREENESAQAAKNQNLYRKELAWIRRGAKARSTKQKARIQRFEELEGAVNKNTQQSSLTMDLTGTRLGKKVIELTDVDKAYGTHTILKDFSFLFKPGDRIGIVGKNGTGKSTLLNMLNGQIQPDSGTIETGQTVKIGYYKQENEDMDENMRMIAYLRDTAEVISLKDGSTISAAQMLERFLFPMNTHGTLIRKLSGGEKRRLYLLKILMSSPNLLLMDEPTNDLDTQTLTVLEDFIDNFSGVVITVSHDRYFLDKCAEQLFVFQGEGRVDKYYGTYSEYLEEEAGQKAKPQPSVPGPVQETKPKPKKKKLTYAEQKEWDGIEERMNDLENRISEVQKAMAGTGSDFEKANELLREEQTLNQELEDTIERWTELSEKLEGNE